MSHGDTLGIEGWEEGKKEDKAPHKNMTSLQPGSEAAVLHTSTWWTPLKATFVLPFAREALVTAEISQELSVGWRKCLGNIQGNYSAQFTLKLLKAKEIAMGNK